MKKKSTQRIVDLIPDALTNTAEWLKNNFDENGQEILGNASGTIGLVIKFFGKPLVDKYFKYLSEKKCDGFGTKTYLKAAYRQAGLSMEKIENEIKSTITAEEVLESFSNLTIKNFEEVNGDNLLLLFQPVYHPVVVQVKNNYVELLKELGVQDAHTKIFIKDYNENIESAIKHEFGSDYEAHQEEVEQFIVEKNEAMLLYDTYQLGRIGFDATENLQYEKAFASWEKVSKYRDDDYSESETDSKKIEKFEKSLFLIENLIDEYFGENIDNIGKMLFIIAGFGKGKSVFMKHYAAQLAKDYAETKEGYFPVYLNLREFNKYNHDSRLGVVSDFLLDNYAIDIQSKDFISKKYVFLLDSLDESGELTNTTIDTVISSIQKIEDLDKTKYRSNQIIISSRPISEGLENHLGSHKPYTIKNQEGREGACFVSLYGFKKEQFNNWLFNTLKTAPKPDNTESISFVSDIFNAIAANSVYDVYTALIENNSLGVSEMRRPIFAYMIYQLIIKNIDFLKVGRIGVYLSFLNLLTKEAKHIKDPNYQVNLKDEFKFRNILHAIAALWMYESRKGKQGELKKASLIRVMKEDNIHDNDSEVINRYKDEIAIEFLSHSYFGEDSDTMHFQHQSFAEMLLAEYYLKIFIKCALDEDAKSEYARCKLHLGKPTEQTILFFIELLQLLKSTCVLTGDGNDDVVLEKRKLLFPLFASMATNEHNTLFSNHIFYNWYKKCKFETNQTEYPQEALINWCFGAEELEKVVSLSAQIINSEKEYILSGSKSEKSLYNNELTLLEESNVLAATNLIDKWLALVVGEHLYTDVSDKEKPKLFNTDYKINFRYLFDLINSVTYQESGKWFLKLFKGIDMSNNESTYFIRNNLSGFDFSFSKFFNVEFDLCRFGNTDFSYCKIKSAFFDLCCLWRYPLFEKISILENTRFNNPIVNYKHFTHPFHTGKSILYFSKEEIFYNYFHTFDVCVRFVKSLQPFKENNNYLPCKENIQILPEGLERYFHEALLLDYDEIGTYFKANRDEILEKVYGSKDN